MEPVEMTPVSAEPPPKANPLSKPTVTATLKPGLRLPPKPGATVAGLKPGLKLPPKPGATLSLKPGVRLPPKPGATVTALKPGLKLPPKPGATVTSLKPGIKLPPKPVIHKPGSTIAAKPLPKPVTPVAASPVAAAPAASPVAAAPAAAPVVAAPVVATPVAVDAQGVGKLPTVSAKPMSPEEAAAPVVNPNPKPLEQLKSVTNKLKGLTQQVPQQAILHKTGIVADGSSEIQKEAAKHKTSRISLSEAIGVAPVKSEATPMKTIRIKRPIDISNATKPLAPLVKPVAAPAPAAAADAPAPAAPAFEAATVVTPVPEASAPAATATQPSATITQRKTLKIARPGGAVRPSGKFGLKRPTQPSAPAAAVNTQAETVVKTPADGEAIADIPDIPSMPQPNLPSAPVASDGPAWLWSLSSLVQAAACVAIGALAYFLYENVNTLYF